MWWPWFVYSFTLRVTRMIRSNTGADQTISFIKSRQALNNSIGRIFSKKTKSWMDLQPLSLNIFLFLSTGWSWELHQMEMLNKMHQPSGRAGPLMTCRDQTEGSALQHYSGAGVGNEGPLKLVQPINHNNTITIYHNNQGMLQRRNIYIVIKRHQTTEGPTPSSF